MRWIFALGALVASLAATGANASPLVASSLTFTTTGPNFFNLGTCGSSLAFGSTCSPSYGGFNSGATTDTVGFTITGDVDGPQSGSVQATYTVIPLGNNSFNTIFTAGSSLLTFSDGVVDAQLSKGLLSFSFTPGVPAVPEPLTISLLGAGLLGAFGMKRKKKAA